ncbi:MAG: FlgD immunoglobulin-like domain containing protein, partial [Endozoicomonas sp.]
AILKTTDGGDTWTRHAVQDSCGTVINKDLEGIGFINEKQGWVGGWGNNFAGLMNSYTTDGGLTWVSEDHNPDVSHSDDRLRINRYRFIGDPVTAGYCSGQQVYKLQFGCPPSKKGAFAKKSAFSITTRRLEPARSDEVSAYNVLSASGIVQQHDFDLRYTQQGGSKVEISYQLPESAGKVFVGLWNQFAFYVKTLVHDTVSNDGRQTIVWDGSDDDGNALSEGVYICRLSVDGCQGGSQMVQLRRS